MYNKWNFKEIDSFLFNRYFNSPTNDSRKPNKKRKEKRSLTPIKTKKTMIVPTKRNKRMQYYKMKRFVQRNIF